MYLILHVSISLIQFRVSYCRWTHPRLALRLRTNKAIPLLPSVPPIECYGVAFASTVVGNHTMASAVRYKHSI